MPPTAADRLDRDAVLSHRGVAFLKSRLRRSSRLQKGERHCPKGSGAHVAGGGFKPPTFGVCDLAHPSMRIGQYLHPRGVSAIQSLRLPPKFRGLGSVLPCGSRDLDSTDFDE